MKKYRIRRWLNGTVHCDVAVDEEKPFFTWKELPTPRIHSPTGFQIGYAGRGPADLALAILIDLFRENLGTVRQEWLHGGLGDEVKSKAVQQHQQLKVELIAKIKLEPGDSCVIEQCTVEAALLDKVG